MPDLYILTRDLTDAIDRLKATFNVDHDDPRVLIVTPQTAAYLLEDDAEFKPFLVAGASIASLENTAFTRSMRKIPAREAGAILKAELKPGKWE